MIYDLVFEGGGAKGVVFVGAIQIFVDRGHTYGRLLGTSAGAITATLLAAGYTTPELLETLSEKVNGASVFATFMEPPAEFDDAAVADSASLATLQRINIPLVPDFIEGPADFWLAKKLMAISPNLFSLIERGGLYSPENFLVWLRRKLDEGLFQGRPRNFSQMTLRQFYDVTNRDLSLVASDTTGRRLLVLNSRTTPDLPVVWAVRMSMSIPMIWPEVTWRPEWGTYRDKNIMGHLIVDGGLLSNFPIELFISDEEHVVDVMGEKTGNRVLGLLIDEALAVEDAPSTEEVTDQGFDFGQLQLIQRLNRLLSTATGAHDKMVLEAFNDLVVRLPARGYGTTEFDMSDARRQALVKAGQRAMREYLDWRDEAPFALDAETSFEIDIADHADRVASSILDW